MSDLLNHARPPAPARTSAAGVLVTVGGFVVLGILVAWLWAQIAQPAEFTVSEDNGFMGETAAAQQFGVTVAYAWLSAVAALGWGAVTAWRFGRLGLSHLVVTVGGAAIAAVLSWRLGVLWGPPDPTDLIRSAPVGSTVPTQLVLDSHGVLFVWPIAALVGLLLVLVFVVPDD